jgi:LytS/YehU family sensor histidine kinase
LFLAMNVVLTLLTRFTDPAAADAAFGRLYTNRLFFKLPAGLGIYAFILAAYGIAQLVSRQHAQAMREAQLQTQLSTAQLRNLQVQLQPHFLFNALHSISGLVREGEGERAVDMIAELSDLLRRALGAADRQVVTLAEELDFLDHYVRIQQLRFGDRLQVCYRIEPGTRSVLIPSLVLQPLVENAIRHGLERTTRAVEVTIGASANHERILIEVSDTGPGPATSPVLERVGLGTTRQRLAQLYGTEQSFTLEPREGGGTLVRLTLPMHMQAPEE